jgi:hypothetical protein
MAAASNIVVSDGQSTPVAHTFSPARKDGGLVIYEERTTANTPKGFYTLGLSQTSPKASNSVIRTKLSLEVPIEVLDSTTGLYSYPSSMRFSIDVLMPKTVTADQRNDIAAYLKNICAHATIDAMIADLDAPY